MKGSDQFKKAISNHLESLAAKDPLFAETFKKENKNIDDCITYILNQVQESGINGFADDEIYGMAVHYYDEDDAKPGKKINATVVVNHKVEFSEKEKKKIKEEATAKAIEEAKQKLLSKKAPKKTVSETNQPTLF